jgi:hypothetical protein
LIAVKPECQVDGKRRGCHSHHRGYGRKARTMGRPIQRQNRRKFARRTEKKQRIAVTEMGMVGTLRNSKIRCKLLILWLLR